MAIITLIIACHISLTECTLKEKYCSECGVKGHIYKMCNKKKQIKMGNVNVAESICSNDCIEEEKEEKDEKDMVNNADVYDIFYFSDKQKIPSATLEVVVDGKVLEFEVDTGADVSTITLSNKQKYFSDLKIVQKNVIFTNFDQSTSTPLGIIKNLNVSYKNVKANNQRLFVVKDGLPMIIGKDWLSVLQLWPPKFEQNICEIKTKDKIITEIKNEYKEIFEPGMGIFKGEPIHLSIEPNVKPIFMPVRTVPFAIKDKVKSEIKRLIDNKRIEPVEYSEWGTPVVPVLKPDGTVRLCGDYQVRDERKNKKKWSLGKVIEILVPGTTYIVEVEGLQWKRHANQLLKCGQTLE